MMHLILAALAAMPPCWSLYDSALTHSAAAAHPPYIAYSERISVIEDGAPLFSSIANIDYRDDGIARVADERFDYDPFLTRDVEPGPPELGPYGPQRSMWLPPPPGVPTIAALRASSSITCTMQGREIYRSRPAYHLVFRGANPKHAHLDDLWIDVQSNDIWKLRITAPVQLLDGEDASSGLGDYDVELDYHGPYLVVDYVRLTYQQRVYSQFAKYVAEYTFTGFSFPKALPASYFAYQ